MGSPEGLRHCFVDLQSGCVAQMSFGGHHALNASDQVQKQLQEAMADDQELQDGLAGINITDDENRSDVSMEQMIVDEVISTASSAAAMQRDELERRVVELETQLLRANAQRTADRAATAAEIRNQAIHDKSLAATAGIAAVISTMDTYTLWWVSQWVDWRKSRIAENGDPH